ncbi:MAG: DUF1049 domain-containing protein [Candidatus Aminicenantes bacterium]|nr:DUF1049 domain-containing protein [Candidatus Aminicenantes bacterium]
MKPKMIVVLVLCIIALVFVFQNSKVITIQLLFWTVSASRIIMVIGLLLMGFLVGYLLGRR